jgi:hypothetical protein
MFLQNIGTSLPGYMFHNAEGHNMNVQRLIKKVEERKHSLKSGHGL